jgi:hypothetical protein
MLATVASGVVIALGGSTAVGCHDLASDLVERRELCPDGTLSCFQMGTGGQDGGTGGSTPGCEPSKNNGPVADSCGVFVSSSKGSDTSGKGTKDVPYQSLGKALASAGGKAVYACGESFTESVTVSTKVTLYGALVCSQAWAYDPTQKTTLTAAADAVPLALASAAGGAAIHDFAIMAPDATKAGGSSIAVLAQANVTLDKVDVTAGKGAPGATGMAQAQVMTPAMADGKDGTADMTCNMAGPIAGGAGGKNTCAGSIGTNGGIGGSGVADITGGNGNPGNPMMTTSNAGSGQTTTMSCTPGGPGAAGSKGTAGTGARGIGDVSPSGYVSPAGALGMPGGAGQGGGGGGGARQCDMMGMFAGPSGGGGGAGGCGGAASLPGQSGGSSIGILALGATLSLSNVSITTHDGGAGGVGGDGQLGGPGGQPGKAPMMTTACDGGSGGQGGAGGPGGGGAGGHAVAVAAKGAALPDLTGAKIVLGKGGAGAHGGDMDMTMQTKGDAGLACRTLDFSSPMSPTACVM